MHMKLKSGKRTVTNVQASNQSPRQLFKMEGVFPMPEQCWPHLRMNLISKNQISVDRFLRLELFSRLYMPPFGI